MPQWYLELRELAGDLGKVEPKQDDFNILDLFRGVVCEWFPPGTYTNPPWVAPDEDGGMTLHAWEQKHGSGTGRVY